MGSERSPDFASLTLAVRAELERGRERNVALQLVCNLMTREVPYYNWFGYYFAVPAERLLVLGPFEGEPTDHIRIPYGTGICGRSAVSESTFLVPDVAAQENYLACSVHVRSEIVVPVFANGAFVGQIDIDSHRVNAFSDADRTFLKGIAPDLAPFFPRI